MERQTVRYLVAGAILIIFYMVAMFSLADPDLREYFSGLSWLILLITAACVFGSQSKYPAGIIPRLMGVALGAFVLQIIGTNTSFPFGPYSYSDRLGFKVLSTPVFMGLFWATIAYGAANLVQRLPARAWVRAITGGIILSIFDFMLEPFAIQFGLWQWATPNAAPPAQNYFAWFVAGSIAVYLLMPQRVKSTIVNPVSQFALILQLLFFSFLQDLN